MSIKGSSKKLKIEYTFWILFFATIAAVAVRTYQRLKIIEPETGFYKVENFSVPLLYGILAVAGVLIFCVGYLAKKVPLSTLPEGRNIPLAVASLLFALTLLLDMVFQSWFNVYYALIKSGIFEKSFAGYGSLTVLFKSGVGVGALATVFAFFSAIYFLVFALKYFGVNISVCNRKILAVMPVFWATMRMVQRFTKTISIINMSDLLLELFMMAFMMMFFLAFAQLASNVGSRHVVNKIYSYGYIGTMFAFTITFPKIAIQFFEPSLSGASNNMEICDLGFAIFALILCREMLKMPREDNITLKEVERLKKERAIEEDNQAE